VVDDVVEFTGPFVDVGPLSLLPHAEGTTRTAIKAIAVLEKQRLISTASAWETVVE